MDWKQIRRRVQSCPHLGVGAVCPNRTAQKGCWAGRSRGEGESGAGRGGGGGTRPPGPSTGAWPARWTPPSALRARFPPPREPASGANSALPAGSRRGPPAGLGALGLLWADAELPARPRPPLPGRLVVPEPRKPCAQTLRCGAGSCAPGTWPDCEERAVGAGGWRAAGGTRPWRANGPAPLPLGGAAAGLPLDLLPCAPGRAPNSQTVLKRTGHCTSPGSNHAASPLELLPSSRNVVTGFPAAARLTRQWAARPQRN